MKLKHLIYALCLFTMIACGSDDSSEMEEIVEACTLSIEPSFRITVLDGADNSLLEGVIVTVINDSFRAVLSAASPGVYIGPEERTGTYLIVLEKEGYETITVTEPQIVVPTEDLCHVDTIETSYSMTAN